MAAIRLLIHGAFVSVALLGAAMPSPGQAILRVDGDALAGGDGATWKTAYRNVQDALLAADALVGQGQSVELWVAAGLYRPDLGTLSRLSRFELRNSVAIYGGFIGIETFRAQRDANPATNGTVLTGDLLGDDGPSFIGRSDNAFNVVYSLGQDATATLDGFTIRGGQADFPTGGFGATGRNGAAAYLRNSLATLRNCAFEDSLALDSGGGAYVLADFGDASPTFDRCRFSGNKAANGGGMESRQTVGHSASPTLMDCVFEDNVAEFNGGGLRGSGGLTRVLFTRNSAHDGGGIDLFTGDLTLFDCDVRLNTASDRGGGVHLQYDPAGSTAYLAGVRIEVNDAAAKGGGVYSEIPVSLAECQFRRNTAGAEGGAIYFDAHQDANGEYQIVLPLADTLIFDSNSAGRGGAVGVAHSAAPQFVGCRFFNNSAAERGGAISTDLLGVLIAPRMSVWACEFRGNAAPLGGAVHTNSTAAYVLCDFVHNRASQDGGAEYVAEQFGPLHVYCRFHGNVAGRDGGGIYNVNGWATLHNCELAGNRAGGAGGGLAGAATGTVIKNCTLTDNVSAGDFGGGVHHPGLGLTLENSIVWGNSPDRIYANGGAFTGLARYSCIAGGAPGIGVFDANPHVVRLPNDGGDGWGDDLATPQNDESLNDDFGDTRLQANSPCIDASDNAAVPADVTDVDLDGTTAEPLPWDLLLDERFREDSGAPNVGVGPAPIADIGAIEFRLTSRLRGDTNCDGRVDFFDIDPFLQALFDYAAYQSAFPACFGNADANLDGAVNFFDIDLFVSLVLP